jgi:hypothetical protein
MEELELLLVTTYTLLFIFCIQKLSFFEVNGLSKNIISVLFLLKIVFGFFVWAVYTYYYTYRPTADVFRYFDASAILFNAFKTNPEHFFKMLLGIKNDGPEFFAYYDQMNVWLRELDSSAYNDNRLIIRINTVMRFFSFGYFHVHTVFFSFLSLIGLTALYKTFIPYLPDKKVELLIIVFLIPSVLFWGSGVLKEGILLFALGVLFYSVTKIQSPHNVALYIALASVALFLIGILKFYVLLCLIPAALFIAFVNLTGENKIGMKFFFILLFTLLFGLNIHKIIPVPSVLDLITHKQHAFLSLAQGNEFDPYNKPIPPARSVVKIQPLQPNIKSFIAVIPNAIENAVFRPFIWEKKSVVILFSAIENLMILSFIIFCLLFAKSYSKINWKLVLFCLAFAFAQLLLIGITTPVMGAIVRYKIIALPFLLIGFLMILDTSKIKQLVQKAIRK